MRERLYVRACVCAGARSYVRAGACVCMTMCVRVCIRDVACAYGSARV